MAKTHPISQARRCKLSSVLLLIVANKDWLAAAAVHGGHRHTHNRRRVTTYATIPGAGWAVGVVSKNKTDCEDSSCIASFREWATAGGGMQSVLVSGSLLLLLSCYRPWQEVTELLKLVTNGQNSPHQPSTQV
jgi:hypothetical protein